MPWRFLRNAMHEARSITRNLKNGAGFWRRETRRPPATVPMHCASGAFPKFDHIGVIPGTERSEGTGNPVTTAIPISYSCGLLDPGFAASQIGCCRLGRLQL